MHIALIDKITKKVVNVVVPPDVTKGDVYSPPEHLDSILTENGNIGDTYENGVFIKPIKEEINV